MTLLNRLEAATKRYDARVHKSLPDNYNQTAADMRDLLEEAHNGILASEAEADRLREIVDDLRALNVTIACNRAELEARHE